MALLKTMSLMDNFEVLVELKNCYIKVEKIEANKASAFASVSINNEDASKNFVTKHYSFDVTLNGENFIKQAYEHLKTLPEFAGAADV